MTIDLMVRVASSLLVLALPTLALTACEPVVPPPGVLDDTQLVAMRVEVVEIGPLNPGRVLLPGATPVAEVMPGDRVRFEAVVVERDGVALPAEELDVLWFQCGPNSCKDFRDVALDWNCGELEPWSTDSQCRIGSGAGALEFVAPPLERRFIDRWASSTWWLPMFAVVAWDGRKAEDCWTARRTDAADFEGCGFLHHALAYGPPWWMLAYAASIGLATPVPVIAFPAPVLGQQANRVPALPSVTITVDGMVMASGPLPIAAVRVRPGSRIDLAFEFDPRVALFESHFIALDRSGDLFEAALEIQAVRVLTTAALRRVEHAPVVVAGSSMHVDADAEPGIARVVLVATDLRLGEDVGWLEFEIE